MSWGVTCMDLKSTGGGGGLIQRITKHCYTKILNTHNYTDLQKV